MRHGWVLPLLLLGCAHSEAFGDPEPGSGGPRGGGPPVRLTYNIGQDGTAAWSDDGAFIYYSAQDSFSSDKDRCIVRMAAGGGSRIPLACPEPLSANGLTEIFDQPAPGAGRVAYASSELGVDEHAPFRHAIWLVADQPYAAPTLALACPYFTPRGASHDAPIYLQWLSPDTLVFIGAENGCCRKDTMRFGEQIVLLDLSGPTPVRHFVPGTTRASAVQAAADGSAIHYTIAGDSRVYRRVLATGVVDTLHDFGPGRVARDPQLVGTRLYAIVDGHDGFTDLPPFYGVQIDYGGRLVRVDLPGGGETDIGDPLHLFKRPRVSPGGSGLVVEGYPMSSVELLDSTGTVVAVDTTVARWADLWLMEE